MKKLIRHLASKPRRIAQRKDIMMYYEYYQDATHFWRWTAMAANHEPIAVSSESYYNERDCLHAIDLMRGSGGAPFRRR